MSEKENRKIEFEVIRVSSLPVYKSHQHENSSPLATAAHWSGIDCHLTSPQYVNSVMSRLHIYSHFVTPNTYKFNYLVRACERTKSILCPFGVSNYLATQINLSCLTYVLQVASWSVIFKQNYPKVETETTIAEIATSKRWTVVSWIVALCHWVVYSERVNCTLLSERYFIAGLRE